MKTTQYTATEIFMTLHALRAEVKDLQRSLEIVLDECGKDSLAYNVLKNMYDEKSNEAIDYENKLFMVV